MKNSRFPIAIHYKIVLVMKMADCYFVFMEAKYIKKKGFVLFLDYNVIKFTINNKLSKFFWYKEINLICEP